MTPERRMADDGEDDGEEPSITIAATPDVETDREKEVDTPNN